MDLRNSCCRFEYDVCCTQVAESLLNPFGEDDNDFEINGLIDENLQVVCMCLYLFYAGIFCLYDVQRCNESVQSKK